MPVLIDGELHAVYACGPETVVLHINEATGATSVRFRHPTNALLTPWRGGSQLLPDRNGTGYLAVVHDVVHVDGQRRYRHRVAAFDATLRVAAATPWFSFEGVAVEFASGLARRSDDLV